MHAWLRQSREIFRLYQKAELYTRAAALAYHTLLGIVPTIGISFWYLSHIHLTDKWLALTKDFISDQLNVSSSDVFEQYFDKLTGNVGGGSWGWVGLILLLYTVWGLIAKLGDSLD